MTVLMVPAMKPYSPMIWRDRLFFLLAVGMLSACTVGPDFVAPTAPEVSSYTSAALATQTMTADGRAQSFSQDTQLPAHWWRLFNSEALDATVQQALAQNPTLQAATASLRQSQNDLRAGNGVFFPWLAADLGAERARNAPLINGSSSTGTLFNVVTASATISYPLDLFGGERRAVEGLAAQVEQQRFLSKAAYLTLSANVVNTCIARAAYAAQIEASEQLIALQQEQLSSIEVQVRSGTQAYANVLSQRSLIAANQALLAPLTQKMNQADHLLALLEGSTPAQATLPTIALDSLQLPLQLPLSLPSALVRQRPDILAAEAQLHVASANVGVATAAMFPSLSLSASYGNAGSSLGNLLDHGEVFWSVGPSLTAPLFQGGSLRYKRNAATDAYEAQLANYRLTVLSAFEQVADALKALQHDAQALQSQFEARTAAAAALVLLQANYRAGLVAYVEVLSADVQLHNASIAYLQAVAQRHQDTVALFVALGGGWWNSSSSDSSSAGEQEQTP